MKSKDPIWQLRRQFVTAYCQKKGWDRKSLTTDQVLKIQSQPGWIKPNEIKTTTAK